MKHLKKTFKKEIGGKTAMKKELTCLGLSVCMTLAPVGGFVHGVSQENSAVSQKNSVAEQEDGAASQKNGAAAQENSAGLLQAIETVKRAVDIPKEYSQFEYSAIQQKTDKGQVQVWSLSWTDPKDGGEISAQADPFAQLSQTEGKQGVLLSYYRYEKSQDQGSIGTVKREAAQKTVEEFLKKALPSSVAGQMKEVGEEHSQRNANTHRFHYMLYEKGTPVKPLSVRIQVDKYSGWITSYQGLPPGTRIPTFPDPKTAMDKAGAIQSYLDKIGMKLEYHSTYDTAIMPVDHMSAISGMTTDEATQKPEVRTVFPVFVAGGDEDADQLVIDGKSGQVRRIDNSVLPRNFLGKADTANAETSRDEALTPEEQKGLKEISGFLTKEEAASALKKQVPQLFGEASYQYASLSKNRSGGSAFQWDFSFEEGSGSVDAQSGRILSLYYGGDTKTSSPADRNISEDQALKQAKEISEKLAPDVFSSCKLSQKILAENDPSPTSDTSYSFRFFRQENGIDFVDNGIFITVDGTGQLRSYHRVWYDDVTFPSITGVLSEKQIFSKIQETNLFEVAFEWGDPQHNTMMLAYEFTDPVAGMLWSPLDGQRLNNDGTPKKEEKLPSYADIKGHWSEATVKELLENGYYIEGESFQPNRVINQSEFLRYLYSPNYSSLPEKDFYRLLENQGVLKEGEAAPDQALARQDAAKFLIRHMGLEQAAVNGELYKNFFSDEVKQGYQGYATLCYGLGIMGGEKGKAFAGAKNMTRAEAASAIYHMLLVK